jgi:protein TonB
MATQTYIAPFYRLYELPWSPTEEVERRFRVVVRNTAIAAIIFGLIIPFLKVEKSDLPPQKLDERVINVIAKPVPPPPPPVVKEEPKPEPEIEKPKPIEQPKPKPQVDVKKQASKALAVFDELDALRDRSVEKTQIRNLDAKIDGPSSSDRSMLTSNVGKGSGGINNSSLSRGYGGGSGSLTGRDTTQVASNLGSGDGRPEVRRTSGSGKGARSREEVELTFDRNKGAIYSIYTRALRDNPDLKGKVVLEITISPTGDVLNCVVVSSELNNPELERKLVLKVKTFKFEPRDVESLTLTKPIDFFPAG